MTVTGAPGPAPGLATRLVQVARTGAAEVGEFTATAGELWLSGQCVGGLLTLHLGGLVTFPTHCDQLAGVPFTHQITLDAPGRYRVWVEAPNSVTWNLRVEQ